MTLILHIGAGKCGSSAIQSSLTQHANLERRDGSTVEYIAIDAKGLLVRGDHLRKSAGIGGYRTSPSTMALKRMDLASIGKALRDIKHDVLLSQEAWIYQAENWRDILEQAGLDAHVFAYVRPHAPLLNSAWWQWGAWKDKPYEEWLMHRLKRSMWGARMREWKSIPRVKSVTVRLLPDDVVADMYAYILETDSPDTRPMVNSSLPSVILRLFQRNRELRPHAHASRIDFILSEQLALPGSSPWVLAPELIEHILSETREDNVDLLSMLDSESARIMREDARWWDKAAFSDKVAESPDPVPIDPDALEKLCVALVKALDAPGKRDAIESA